MRIFFLVIVFFFVVVVGGGGVDTCDKAISCEGLIKLYSQLLFFDDYESSLKTCHSHNLHI